MGATSSQITTKQEVKDTVKLAASEDKILIDKILAKSRELYQKNKENFLNEKFCDKIVLTYSKKLYELPIQQVKRIYDGIESNDFDLELNTRVDNLEEEKFLVNELSGKLVDRFKNQKLKPGMQKGIQIKYPDVAYIQNRVLRLLGEINNFEQRKIVGGKRNGRYNNNNNNNDYENNEEEFNENNNNYNNNEEEEEEEENININRKNKKPWENKILNQTSSMNYKSEIIINAKKELENILKENTEVTQIKENKKININKPKENKKNTNNKPNEKVIKPKNIIPYEDKYCVDDKPCNLTKSEMCEKIIYHFVVRNNLIAAILSTVPAPDKNGEYKGSFTYERLRSLEKGEFCLPPYNEIKYNNEKIDNEAVRLTYENQRIGKILQYINLMNEKECTSNGGRFLILKKEQFDSLYRDDALGRKYFDFAIKINNFYQNTLIALYDILENLSNNIKISTKNLNEISEKTKSLIDELYLKTQFNYLLAVLLILEFKFEKETPETEIKNNRIKKIISEDFTI